MTHDVTGQLLQSKVGAPLKVTATGKKGFTISLGGGATPVHAIPTPAVKPTPPQTTTTVSLLGSRAQVAVRANATVPYGELLTVVARVVETTSGKPVTSGTVHFTEDGTSVKPEFSSSAICQAVPVVKGTASCAITGLAADSTPYQFGASYSPIRGSLGPSGVTSSHGVAVTVARASTTISLSGEPDPSSPGDVRLQAVVANSSVGSSLAPVGAVSFAQGGVALACRQGQPVLIDTSISTSSVSCDVPAPSGTTTYTALYVPVDRGDFAASGPVSVTVTPSVGSARPGSSGDASAPGTAPGGGSAGPSSSAVVPHTSTSCSAMFSTLWGDGTSGSTTLTFSSPQLGFLSALSVTETATSGTCDPSTNITFSDGSLSFLGGTLGGTGLGGTITDATSTTTSPQLCITSGNLGGEGVTVSGSLCFSISSVSGTSGTVDNVSSASLSQVGTVTIASVLTLSGVTITIGNGSATTPAGCTLNSSSDWWLTVSGNLALSLSTPSVSANATATGCVDLSAGTKGTFELTSDLGTIDLTSSVTLDNFDVTLTYSSSSFSVLGSTAATISIPSGGSATLQLTVAFDSSGTLVVGGSVDLSNLSTFLPSSLTSGGDVSAFVAYATAKYPSFDTGITSIGTIDLVPGLNFAVSMSLPSSITTALSPVNITLPSTVLAIGSFDTSTDTFNLAISVTFASAVQLFDDQGVALDLISANVTLEVSPSQVSISFSMDATLYPDGLTGQQVPVTGTLSAVIGGSPSVSISVAVNESTLGTCGSGSGWTNAFSDNGLTVKCAEVTVGVTTVAPFVSGSINGVITQLPSDIASAIGYKSPAPIAFAFGFNPYYLDLSIGTYGSSAIALEPLAAFDNGSYATDLEVNYAQLCFMQPDATPLNLGGGLTCAPGFVLGFTATIDASIFENPVTVNFLASLSINPTSFEVTASISQITVGQDLNVGPVTLVVCGSASPTCDNNTSYFQFEFDGSFSLSGSVTVPDLVQLSGSLSLTLNVDLSTSGFSAFASGSASGTVTGYNPFANCSGTWYNPATWSCSGAWDSPSSFSFKLGTTGIAAGSTGLTVTIDGYSVTFPFNTNDPPSAPVPTTAVTLSSSVNGATSTTSTYGQSVTLTATVTTTGPTFDGGGTVSFYVGAEPIVGCSGTTAVALTDSSGTYTATCTTSQAVAPSSNDTMILPGGSDPIVAEYSGDTGFPPAESSVLVETVSPATPTLTVTSTPSPDYYGQSLSLSVSVSPTDGGGTVTFMDNGTSIPGCVTLSLAGDAGLGRGTDDSAQATCVLSPTVAAGTHPITVSYTGDASANAATSAIDDVVVNKDNTTTSVSESPTTVNYGNESASVFTVTVTTAHGESLPTTDPVTVHVGSAKCVARVAPSAGGGTGTCSIGNTDLDASTAAYQVTAAYPGDADLNASGPATATGLIVQKDPTTTVVSVSGPVTYANETSVAFTVAVTPDYGLIAPSEEVTITVGSTSCVVTSLTNGQGSCSIATPVLPVGGPYTLSATYPGAANFRSSTDTITFDVVTTSTPDCSNYAGADLAGMNLAGANLAGCNLSGANLKDANLEGASLAGANLTGANLMGAVLQGDNLVNADLQSANLKGDNIQYVNLEGVDLQNANLMYANLYETYDFSGANLEGANFQKANLTDANLTDANLTDANFQRANLTDANLTDANLTDANFHFADLEGANLTGAIIKGTQFRGANMTHTTS